MINSYKWISGKQWLRTETGVKVSRVSPCSPLTRGSAPTPVIPAISRVWLEDECVHPQEALTMVPSAL